MSGKSENILQSVIAKSPIRLSWTHYRIILQESNKEARDWYEQEAAREMWGTRTLQRNVSSQYYHRLLQSQNKDAVRGEMKQLTAPLQDKLEYIKNPVVAEFLGFKNRTDYTESDLEQTIIDHLIPFQMEMGKGFALVDRQKRIHTEKDNYYIDMVFYNYNLRSFVLNGSDQLFAAKYLTYMPSRADLRREIEQQKEFFLLQHKGENKD